MKYICQEQDLSIKEIFLPFETNCIWGVVQVDNVKLRSMKTNAKDFCNMIARTIFQARPAIIIQRPFIVGDDIDPYDFNQVLWAYATRCRPNMDEWFIDDILGFSLVPYMSHGPGPPTRGGKSVSNCLLPIEYTGEPNWQKADFRNAYSKALQAKVLRNWKSMGF